MSSGKGHSRSEMILYSFAVCGVLRPRFASWISSEVAGTAEYFDRGSLPDLSRPMPQGCCQHFRVRFQWKPSSFNLSRTSFDGATLNSSQTHLPTTLASDHISGICCF